LAAEVFSDKNGPQQIAHCKDTVAIADEELRTEISKKHPATWNRMAERQRFMRERLGIEVSDDRLPLSVIPAFYPPFLLSPGMALCVGN
jgi:hypothetical protein